MPKVRLLKLLLLRATREAASSKAPSFLKPATTIIKQNRLRRTLVSINSRYSAEGGLKKAEITAAKSAARRTVSVFRT